MFWLLKVLPAPEFFARFGVTEDFFAGEEKILLFDAGFKGSVAETLQLIFLTIFFVKNTLVLKNRIKIGLVGLDEGVDSSYRFINFDKLDCDCAVLFPRIHALLSSRRPLDFYIASAIQLMPRYHGHYSEQELKRDAAGILMPIPLEEPLSTSLDNIGTVNDSLVNPLAAMLVQRRVSKYFSPSFGNAMTNSLKSSA